MTARSLILMSLVLACGGCESYQFDILDPPTADREIHNDRQTLLMIDPLQYRLQADEGRLVMLIYNPTSDPIQLLGGKSAVVDPDGQSHPLRDQTIAPASFIKEIFPPMRYYEQQSPSIGIGVGTVIGGADQPGYIPPNGYGAGPERMDVYGDSSILYWDWQGESDVRMTLTFIQGNTIFSHSLSFHRVKR